MFKDTNVRSWKVTPHPTRLQGKIVATALIRTFSLSGSYAVRWNEAEGVLEWDIPKKSKTGKVG